MKYCPFVAASCSKIALLASVAAVWLVQPARAQTTYDDGTTHALPFINLAEADATVESLTVANAGTQLETAGGVTVGTLGEGMITVSAGARLQNSGFSLFGKESAGKGRLDITGAGSVADFANVTFGENGYAGVIVQNGGILNVANAAVALHGEANFNINTGGVFNVSDGLGVGVEPDSAGTLIVNGNGSGAHLTRFAQIGWKGTGNLWLQEGAHFSVATSGEEGGNLDIGSFSGTDAAPGGNVIITGRVLGEGQSPVPDDFSSLNVARSINLGGNDGYGMLEIGATGTANAANVWIKSGSVVLSGGFLNIDPVGEFDGIQVEANGRFIVQSGGFSAERVGVNGGRLNFSHFFAIPTKEVVVEGATKHLANWFLSSAAWFDHVGLTFGQNALDEVQVSVVGGSTINGTEGVNIGWEGKGTVHVNGGSTIKGGHLNVGSKDASVGELNLGWSEQPGATALFTSMTVGEEGVGRIHLNAGGSLQTSGGVNVGWEDGGQGEISLNEGASLTAGNGLTLGGNIGSDGFVTLHGAFTRLDVTRFATIGRQGYGELQVNSGADVMIVKATPTAEDDGGGHLSIGAELGVDDENYGGEVVVQGTAEGDENNRSSLMVHAGINIGGANGFGILEVANRGLVQAAHIGVQRGIVAANSMGELRVLPNGGLHIQAGGELYLDGGIVQTPWLNNEGGIAGRGTISTPNVNGNGSIDVGLSDSGGVLQINGNLQLSSSSITRIDFFTSTFDQLRVDGNITTGGSIELHFAAGFVPVNGRAYRIIEWTGSRTMAGDVQIQGLEALAGWQFYPSWQDQHLMVTAVSLTGGGDFNDNFATDEHWANWSTSGDLVFADNTLRVVSTSARTWASAPARDSSLEWPNHLVGPFNTPWSVTVQVHLASGLATQSGDILRAFLFVNQQPAVGPVPDNDLTVGVIRSNNIFTGLAGDGVASSVVVRRNYQGSIPTVVSGTTTLTDAIIKLDYTAEKVFVASYATLEAPEVFHEIGTYDPVALWGTGAASFFRVSLAVDAESRNPTRTPAFAGFADGDVYFSNFKSTGLVVESAAQVVAEAAAANLPNITVQPNQNGPAAVLAGQSLTLTVGATGDGLTYQWRKNGQAIESATTSELTIAAMSANDVGRYDVIVGNSSGTVLSQSVMAQLLQPAGTFPNFAWRNPLPAGGSLNDVVFANGKFVAVGVGGRIRTSTDGVTWSTTMVPSQTLNAVAFSGALGKFFAAGASGDIYASTDGTTWMRQATTEFDYLLTIAASPNQVIAGGGNGVIYTSADGVTWMRQKTPVWSIEGLAFGNDTFVSVGHGGQVQRSVDGTTWVGVTVPEAAQNAQINDVKFIDGKFIAVGGNGLAMTSTDGATWTVLATNSGGYFRSVGKFGSNWVINDANSTYLRSLDLTTFTMGHVAGSTGAYLGVAGGPNRLVMVGAGGSIASSMDAVNWGSHGSVGGNDGFFAAIVVDDQVVFVGNEGTIMTTTDGVKLTRRSVDGYRNALSAITHDGEQFVVATHWSQVLTSPDAVSWTIRNTDIFTTWNGAASNGSRTLIVGNQGKIAYSADAIAWTETASGVATDLRDVVRWGDGFVAVGNQGTILTSADGVTWEQRTSGTSVNLNAVNGWNDTLYVVGDEWTLLKSQDDGATWSPVSLSRGGPWGNRDITRLSNGLFVIVTGEGALVTSPDGEHWSTQRPIGTSEPMHAIVQLGDSVMLAGGGGAILQSTVPAAVTPAVSVQPETLTVVPGSAFSLSIEVAGSGSYSFQWFRNGQAIPGATSRSIHFVDADSGDAGEYGVSIYHLNGAPVQSEVATVTVGGGSSGEPGDGSGGDSIVGSWIHGDPMSGEAVVLTFFSNGTYYLAHDGEEDDTGGPGMERGGYSWNPDTGAFGVTIEGDTTGEWGLSHLPSGAKIVLTNEGATFELLVADEDEPVVFKRVASASNPIVGGWLYGQAGALDSAVVTFTANGYYFIVEDGVADESGGPGMEMGTYTSQDGTLVTTALRETNADWGLGMVGHGPVSFPAQIGTTTLVLEEDDEEEIRLVRATAVGLPPAIIEQPYGKTVNVGGSWTFQVGVSGTPPFVYQWFKDGQAISGETQSSLTLDALEPSDSGNYTVHVGNIAGSLTSKAAVLTVNVPNAAPSIITQPASATVAEDHLVTLSVEASGTNPMHYQWRRNGVALDGATNPMLRFVATPGTAGDYTVVVKNSVGSVTSDVAKIGVNATVVAPTITAPPVNQTVTAGTAVRFAVGATGTALTYQWLRNGEQIPGATAAVLSIANPQEADEGNYNVIVTNSASFAESGIATLTVNPAVVAPSIATQPLSQTVTAGESVSFTVVASGTPSLTYQWRRNGVALAGANAATLTIAAAKVADAGSYNVVVTNSAGHATSDSARLNVTPAGNPPVFTVQPIGRTVTVGANVTFNATATGSDTITYQWRRNGSAITGATAASLTLNDVQSSNAGSYTLVATNDFGFAISSPAPLTVNPAVIAPSITSAKEAAGALGSAFTYAIVASNSPTSFGASGLPAGFSIDPATGVISGTATAGGTFSVTLTATNAGGTGTATLTLTIVQPVPVVTSAPSATGRVGEAFTYTITGTNSPTSFDAANLPAGLTVHTTTGVISGVPTSAGAFNVALTASNPAGSSRVFLLALKIAPSASVPGVTSAAAATGKVGEPFTYVIEANNSPTSFNATGLPPGLTVNSTTGLISGTPTTAGTFAMAVTASNGTGAGNPLAVLVTISPAATTPVITSSASAAGTAGEPFTYAIKATNSPTSFVASGLPTGLTFDADKGVISGTPTAAGDFIIAIGATNAAGTGVAVVTLTVAPGLSAPKIMSAGSANGRVGETFHYAIVATNTPTSFGAVNLPEGLTLSSDTGVISGTPTVAGMFAVTLTASNTAGAGAAFTLKITIAAAAAAPVVTSEAAAVATTGTLFNYQITATNGPLTGFSATGLPAGLAVNPLNGLITGTPTHAGSYAVVVTASNATGTSAPLGLLLTVNAGIQSPSITSSLTASGTQGQLFTYLITASNMPLVSPLPPGNEYAATDLPAGLALNPSNGIIVGVPTATGTFNVGLTATNDAGTGAMKTLVITINAAPNAPVITSGTTAAATAGSGFNYQITAQNSPTGFDLSDAPAWLSVDTDTGLLTGTPTGPGEFAATLVASNAAGTSAPVTLTITVAPAAGSPSVTSTLSATGEAGTAFSYQIAASNGPLASFSATGMPDGLSLDPATGLISGTPTVPGNYDINIAAQNAIGFGASKTLEISISAAAGSPVIGGSAEGSSEVLARSGRGMARALMISRDAVQGAQVDIPSSGTVGVPYSFQITASGSPTGYSATGLPSGLAVNPATGLISGSPSVAGTFRIEIRATNAIGVGASATLVLTIAAPPTAPAINSAASASGTVDEAFTYTATATNTPTSFNASGLPAGLVLDATTGVITGSPTTAGTFDATLSANNEVGTGAAFAFTITIAPAAGAPTITSAASASGQVGEAFSYQVVASESPTAYVATGLPAGVSIDQTTGAISGTPVVAGTFVATVTASNVTGGSAPFMLTITVAASASTSSITSAANVSVEAGTSFAYAISATNSPLSYNIGGVPAGLSASTSTGLIDGVPTTPGTYQIVISANNAVGTGETFTLTLTVVPADDTPGEPGGVSGARLTALATRAHVGAGDKVLITGFVIAGSEAKPVMVRASGPALTAQGVSGVLQNPRIELYRQQSHIDANDDWGSEGDAEQIAATATRVGAFALASGSKDAVIVTTLEPGIYTAVIHGNGGTGVALAEIYDISEALPAEAPRLTAISGRGEVGTGENIMIAGLVINGDEPKRVLVRAIGPSLTGYGVTGALANPMLQLFRSGVPVGDNDDWASGDDTEEIATAAAQVGAFAIDEESKDAALLVTLQPGAYTVHASGADGATGVALIEVYELPELP